MKLGKTSAQDNFPVSFYKNYTFFSSIFINKAFPNKSLSLTFNEANVMILSGKKSAVSNYGPISLINKEVAMWAFNQIIASSVWFYICSSGS